MPKEEFKAINTTFTANSKKAVFSTDIAGAYPDDAHINSWVRVYSLDRGKKFKITDEYEFNEIPENATSLNLITYSKVSEIAPGKLKLEGDGFLLSLKYDSKKVTPKLEFIEVLMKD